MREPMEHFSGFLDGFTFTLPSIPVVANVTARPYGGDVRETLAKQIGHSVRWLDTVLFLVDNGVTEFQECGPGTVLTKIAAQIRKARA
jgi:malonyl CoA-acyl carrier protein transacylase